MNTFEDRLRRGLVAEADARPLPTGHPHVSTKPAFRGVAVAFAAAAVMLVVVGGGALVSRAVVSTGRNPNAAVVPPSISTAAASPLASSTTVEADPAAEPAVYEGVLAVRRDPLTGDLMGIRDFGIYRSPDDGQSWTWFHGEVGRQIEAFDISPNGAIVAIENRNDIRRNEFGPNSTFNDPPQVHLYDPKTEQWTVTDLPRPELPVAGLAPAPVDGSGTCGLGGLQSWVDGVAVAYGDRIAIVGSQRVTGDGICDEDFPFFWTSLDGTEWSIVPDTGTPVYLTGLMWMDDAYVGYGSRRPSYVGASIADFNDPNGSLDILTSTDLATWTPVEIDLSVLPNSVIVDPGPSTSGASGPYMAGPVPAANGTVAVVFPAYAMAPIPDVGLADVEELTRWLIDNGQIAGTETPGRVSEVLDSLEVDFPLDADETHLVWNFYSGGFTELVGQLLIERTDDGRWKTAFNAFGE